MKRLPLAQPLALSVIFSLLLSAASPKADAQTTKSPRWNEESSGVAAERIRRIESGFAPISLAANEPPVKLNLRQLMEISNVSQLSVAVIDDYKIAWAKGYGITDAGEPVTPHTLFPACSISKPVTAMAALRLVEQGKLSLDDDVNQKLKSWKVPENEFTRGQKVTLRRILTHTAGTTVHGFLGYEPGKPIPTLVQSLNGEEPANNPPVRVDYVPGTKQRYSGGGFLILQQLMTDVTGEPFPRLMRELVLDRLGLKDSTFEEPLPPSRARMAASGRDRNGEPVATNVVPEMAVGGLWTTPSDLGRIAIEATLSEQGRSNRVLSEATAREMLRPQVSPQIPSAGGPTMRMGLGWELGDESDAGRFGHDGVNVGFKARLFMWESGHGVVVMMNNWSFDAELLMRYLLNRIAEEYGWRYRVTPETPWPLADTVLLATAKLRGAQAAIKRYYELKKAWAEQKAKGESVVRWASNPPDWPPNEWDLFGLANAIADKNHVHDAIEILKVEVREYPKFWMAYDTLGDLYARAGDKQLAIESYEKSVELNPNNRGAVEALKKLKGLE